MLGGQAFAPPVKRYEIRGVRKQFFCMGVVHVTCPANLKKLCLTFNWNTCYDVINIFWSTFVGNQPRGLSI